MTNQERADGEHRGLERRYDRVLLTRNSEYYCVRDTCLAVRDRKTGQFLTDHAAIGRQFAGSIRLSSDGRIESVTRRGEEPHPGMSLLFSNGKLGEELLTSKLRLIEHPSS